jgi:hypothetical protein
MDFFRSQQSPRADPPPLNVNDVFASPNRNGSSLLPRRFTTDSGRVPTLPSIPTITARPPEPQDFAQTSVCWFLFSLGAGRGRPVGEGDSADTEGAAYLSWTTHPCLAWTCADGLLKQALHKVQLVCLSLGD